MEAHFCMHCKFWIPQGVDTPTGYCKGLLYSDKAWLKDAVKKYSDSCANFEPKYERQDETENDFPFI